MDIKTHSCILLLEGTVVSASHDGYCSGNECEDIEVTEQHYVLLECFSDKVIEQLKYLESVNALDELFNSEIGFSYKTGGLNEDNYHVKTFGPQYGFCNPSPSGRHHETDFTATKVLGVLDNNAPGVNVDPYWVKAEINEKALEEFVGLLQVE